MRDRQYVFAPFRLDPASRELWRGEAPVPLRPKLFAVLSRLVEGAGRLVTREELREAVWPRTAVSESVLRGTIRELRDVLDDDAAAARFIETIPHRGYRFVAPVTTAPATRAEAPDARSEPAHADDAILIGRAGELARLRQALARAMQGTRQVVFVTGEPGIGKTAVVDAFLASAAHLDDLWTARGQCVPHYGSSEAYLPVLEALGQLCRQPGGERLLALLGRHAPIWLSQMPGLASDDELAAARRRAEGATRERMLRELAEALEALTAATTLVLVLEDLHWSDYSTLDLVSMLAQRRAPARLLVLGTYRAAEVIVSAHPLKAIKQELLVHEKCEELPLRFLTGDEVREYLAARFRSQRLPAALGRAIHRSTEGNPLFMVNVVDDWLRENVLVETAGEWKLAATVEDVAARVPESLRQMIEKQLERLTEDECRTLEVAGVAGAEFSAAAVAAVLAESADRVEQRCEELSSQGRFLQARGIDVLADGTATGRYVFIHALYRQVLYERLAAARRARLHRRLGEWAEEGSGGRVKDSPAELAMHFERGGSHPRAMRYLSQAADNAMRRQAPHEAIALLERSLALLKTLPDSTERAEDELARLVAIGVPLLMTRGYAAEDVQRTYARARDLCRQLGESPQLLPALAGLFRFYFVRAEFPTARALADQILRLAERSRDTVVSLVAHSLLGALSLSLGEFVTSREHLEKGIALYDRGEHAFMASLYGDDPGVTCRCFLAMSLWFLGYPDRALANVREALSVAREIGSPYCETFALDFVTWIHVLRREEDAAEASIEALLRIAPQQGFPFLLADGRVLHGSLLAARGEESDGLRQMRGAIEAYEATGAVMSRPAHLMLLAAACDRARRTEEGLSALTAAEAVLEQTGERTYEAELHRLRAELTLHDAKRTAKRSRAAAEAQAEKHFLSAIETARRQQAKSLELRAALGLSQLWHRRGEGPRARQLLAGVHGGFGEGFDTPDLRDAAALLAQLS